MNFSAVGPVRDVFIVIWEMVHLIGLPVFLLRIFQVFSFSETFTVKIYFEIQQFFQTDFTKLNLTDIIVQHVKTAPPVPMPPIWYIFIHCSEELEKGKLTCSFIFGTIIFIFLAEINMGQIKKFYWWFYSDLEKRKHFQIYTPLKIFYPFPPRAFQKVVLR